MDYRIKIFLKYWLIMLMINLVFFRYSQKIAEKIVDNDESKDMVTCDVIRSSVQDALKNKDVENEVLKRKGDWWFFVKRKKGGMEEVIYDGLLEDSLMKKELDESLKELKNPRQKKKYCYKVKFHFVYYQGVYKVKAVSCETSGYDFNRDHESEYR